MTATTRPKHYIVTHDLARECYERYRDDYQRQHNVALDGWDAVPLEVQQRWVAALTPVADKLHGITALEQDLEHTRTWMERLRDAEDRASARLSRLESAVDNARRALPDMVALGLVPAPLVQLLNELTAALDDAQSPKEERPVAA
jgi:septation ring formation regulator EzrA